MESPPLYSLAPYLTPCLPRLETTHQHLLVLWHQLHLDMRSLLSWQYLIRDIQQIQSWSHLTVSPWSRCQHGAVPSPAQDPWKSCSGSEG